MTEILASNGEEARACAFHPEKSRLLSVRFTLHNEEHAVTSREISPTTRLVEYLRVIENLKGTKYMCLEGGCGVCVVAVTRTNPYSKKTETFAVNSCLVSIFSCQDWRIHTVEGIGNKLKGYHPIQKALAKFNGTQCGFCSPGMVMNMYALYESRDLTMKRVEDSFGGNICRCTGYRPILTAFKSLAVDADPVLLGVCPDIESLDRCAAKCTSLCRRMALPKELGPHEPKWYKVYSINEIFDVWTQNSNKSYQLVAGNTARGVYPEAYDNVQLYVDVSSVESLQIEDFSPNALLLGGNKTLTETMVLFRKIAATSAKFGYLEKLAVHIEKVAHVPVRNIGTLAGNLSIKHDHPDFPSDIFVIFEAAKVRLNIAVSKFRDRQLSLSDYLSFDMRRKVLKNLIFPPLDDSYIFGSYKIMQRAQNAHAIVNAGFLLQLTKSGTVQTARLVYGGINPAFVRATNTEKYLTRKTLYDNSTLQGAFDVLHREIEPDEAPTEASPTYRRGLAVALFYKFVLASAPDSKTTPINRSGGWRLNRPISTGAQDFQTNESLYPLTQPIPKLEALGQTSGEVQYITDMPELFNELHGYFMTAQAPANSRIIKVDPSAALALEGVLAYYDKNDIRGINSFIPPDANYPDGFFPPSLKIVPEEIFCSGTVQYYFQPVGMVVAETQELAEKAAGLVEISYAPPKSKPLLTIEEVLKTGDPKRVFNEASIAATSKGTDVKKVVKGKFKTSWQYHYHMETQICLVVPKENNLDVYAGTQWMDVIQTAIALVLGIPENLINMSVRRLGGAFGAKITRNSLLACAAALAAHKLQRPVRMRMTFNTNMDVIGKRFPSLCLYEVGLNDDGVIQYLNSTIYLDYGAGGNEPIIAIAMGIFYDSYKHETWTVSGNDVRSENHAGVWTRAPGSTTMIAMIESIMEHIAVTVGKPSLDIRLTNMDPNSNKRILQFLKAAQKWSDYDNRLVSIENYNKENRWFKKGISLIPMTFNIAYAYGLSAMVAIYAGDGSATVTHGGIEIGQGINTKVAQVCAFALQLPLDMVTVQPSNNMASPNNFTTGGSLTSESVCYATLRACETLLDRIKPVRDKMPDATWSEVITACQKEYVELVAHHLFNPNDPVQGYLVYGACVSEVEVDILTGAHLVTRVDLVEDTGNSMSPCIDVGQVEGAFIMGLGFWTTEETIYNKEGRLMNNRTWNYKPPGAQDIPIDFRVKFPKNNPNAAGVLHSKATGEPPLCLSCSIPIAIRHAVGSARSNANPSASKWYPFDGPSTVENTFLNSLNDYKQYLL